MIVIDTNVISEVLRSKPHQTVLTWFEQLPKSAGFLTSISQAELLYGIELLPAGNRRTRLHSLVTQVLEDDFAGRILPFASDAAGNFARILASRRKSGRPMSYQDAQIAAIVATHKFTLATRNTS